MSISWQCARIISFWILSNNVKLFTCIQEIYILEVYTLQCNGYYRYIQALGGEVHLWEEMNVAVRWQWLIHSSVRTTLSLLMWCCSLWCSFRFGTSSLNLLSWTSSQISFQRFCTHFTALSFQFDVGTWTMKTVVVTALFATLSAVPYPLCQPELKPSKNKIFFCVHYTRKCAARGILWTKDR